MNPVVARRADLRMVKDQDLGAHVLRSDPILEACLVQPLLFVASNHRLNPTTPAPIPRHTIRINVHRGVGSWSCRCLVAAGDMSKMWCGERLALRKDFDDVGIFEQKCSAPSSYLPHFFTRPIYLILDESETYGFWTAQMKMTQDGSCLRSRNLNWDHLLRVPH
jgi:hypothetical protein